MAAKHGELTIGEAIYFVGNFMFRWAGLEFELHRTIEGILSLGPVEGSIVTANLDVNATIQIVRCAIDAFGPDPTWITEADDVLKQVKKHSEDRNIVAHNLFGPSKDGSGIKFLRTHAKAKLTYPEVIWSKATMEEKLERMTAAGRDVARIREELAKARLASGPGGLNSLLALLHETGR